jgi:acetylglutamate kinase
LNIEAKKVVVIKMGGSILNSKDLIVQDVVALQISGQAVVLVHGGASMVTSWMAEQGVTAQFYHGERITDAKSLSVVTAVLAGLANKETTAAIIEAGGKAAGVSGVDGNMIQGRVRDQKLGYLGDIVKVDPCLLRTLLEAGFMPVVSPVSLNTFGRQSNDPLLLNVNGDTVAGEIAVALGAEQLVFLTDVDGVRDGFGKVLSTIKAEEITDLLESGVASGGMLPKLKACFRAARAGTLCQIVDGRNPRAVIDAIKGNGNGSTITIAGR